MALEAGSRLGPYEVVARLGAGGMGEVYRAHDPRLGRDVAIKLLPDAFAQDPDRLARFEREAKLLASLQHAHIAPLYGLEEADGRRFLVMPCIEGESLAERLARGALPVPEALEIAAAIAAGLEAAHESGVIHRDLKPGNVMVTPAGDVKVLDFGLAKGGAGAAASDAGLSASPTMTYAATHAGVILGTAAYMSPEQARGKPVDRRTDVWSFGCVLFELLSGRQAFSGETVSDIVASILQGEPQWSALPAATPARVRELLARCLQKDAKRRLRDVGDARLELDDVIAGRVSASGVHATPATPAAPRRPWLAPALTVCLALALGAAWFAGRSLGHAAPGHVTRFQVAPPADQYLPGEAVVQSISPDGTMIALIAADSSGTARIWIRSVDAIDSKVVPGTEGVTTLFWSPDSRHIGFFSDNRRLSRVPVAGGAPEPICDVRVSRGGTWSRDGVILLAPYSNGPLYRVPASGGEPVIVMRPDSAHGETGLRFPSFLPDGRHFLYSSLPVDGGGLTGRVCVGSLDGGPGRVLMHAECGAVYADPGWLLFTRRSVLMAQRFDPRSLEVVGEPVRIGDRCATSNLIGAPFVSASRTGTVAYRTVDPTPGQLAWLDSQGRVARTVPGIVGDFERPQLSRDDQRVLLMTEGAAQNRYTAYVDLARGILTRITPEDRSSGDALWAPDGRGIAYVDESHDQRVVLRSLADGSERVLLASDHAFKRLHGWSRDGRFILYGRLDSATRWDMWLLPVDGSAPRPVLHTPANEEFGSLSPDDRLIAFQSDESGRAEVYVMPLAGPGLRYQVTNGGGTYATWSRSGSHLLFSDPRWPNAITAARLRPGPDVAFDPPTVFAHLPEMVYGADLSNSGEVLAIVPSRKAAAPTATVVQNWQAALTKR